MWTGLLHRHHLCVEFPQHLFMTLDLLTPARFYFHQLVVHLLDMLQFAWQLFRIAAIQYGLNQFRSYAHEFPTFTSPPQEHNRSQFSHMSKPQQPVPTLRLVAP